MAAGERRRGDLVHPPLQLPPGTVVGSIGFERYLAGKDGNQLAEMVSVLNLELTKRGAFLCAILARAMEDFVGKPLPDAVESLAPALRMRDKDIWALLRNDFAAVSLRGGSTNWVRTVADRAENVLAACGCAEDVMLVRQLQEELQQLLVGRQQVMDQRDSSRRRQPPANQQPAPRVEVHRATPQMIVAPRVIPDLPGRGCKPDPLAVTTTDEFVKRLGELHVWAGEPSLRELARNCGGAIAHSTFSTMLTNPRRLPQHRTVVMFLRALGCGEDDVQAWTTVWREIRFKRRTTASTGPPTLQITAG